MLLCITTDYAIRCMLQLAICSKICIASEVADAMSIPLSNLRKVIRLLKEAHLIETHQGQNGRNPSYASQRRDYAERYYGCNGRRHSYQPLREGGSFLQQECGWEMPRA